MYSRGYNTRGYQAPGYKSTAKPVSQKELSEAQEAMKLLKMKMEYGHLSILLYLIL